MHTKRKKYDLSSTKAKVAGFAYDVKGFPRCEPGEFGFPKPPAGPPTHLPIEDPIDAAHFEEWVKYYRDVVGYYVSVLNGLQFNLDDDKNTPPKAELDKMVNLLDAFATALGIGAASGQPQNPKQLTWPLTGPYTFRHHIQSSNPGPSGQVDSDYWVDAHIYFSCCEYTYLCLNARVEVQVGVRKDKNDPFGMAAIQPIAEQPVAGGPVNLGQNPDYVSSSSKYLATSSSSSG